MKIVNHKEELDKYMNVFKYEEEKVFALPLPFFKNLFET
jgi:hypothetical protein